MIVRNTRVSMFASVAGAICIVVSGCKAPPPPPAERADFAQTLNKYYEGRPMCLWQETVRFPVKDASPDQIEQMGLAMLADAGLLMAKPAARGAEEGSKTFDLTPEGRSALTPDVFHHGAGNFCYGRRKVLSVDAARRNSSTTELVDFHYSVKDPAAWATEFAIQNGFPNVTAELAAPHMAEVTLLDTTDGWEVSGTPATITPIPSRPHTSALAKAKSLLHLKRKSSEEEIDVTR